MSPGSAGRLERVGSLIGPPLAVFGALSYFVFFVRFPTLRDLPWINFLILIGAVALTTLGLRRRPSRLARVGAIASAVVTSTILLLFTAYVFWISFLLPPPTSTARSLDRIPDLTLVSAEGEAVELGSFRGRKLVIVFYRGFW